MDKKLDDLIELALKSTPDVKLEDGFSDRLIKKIHQREYINKRHFLFWLICGCISMVSLGIVTFVLFAPKILAQSFDSIISFEFNHLIIVAMLAGALIVLIQYLDEKYIKEKILLP